MTTHHIYIPDMQVKPRHRTTHIRWIGTYIREEFGPRARKSGHKIRVIQAGDWHDMESLSSYDQGKKAMENRRYKADIAAGNEAIDVLGEAMTDPKHKTWWPDSLDVTGGNHEYRILRAIENNAQLDGLLGMEDIEEAWAHWGFTYHEFLKVIQLDGVMYSHYFVNRGTGKPIGGENIKLRIRKLGGSFTQGHEQTLDYGKLYAADGREMNGLVAGAGYLHNETYLGPQGNVHWRGIVVCHDVRQGAYDLMAVSLDYLCRRYEGKSLKQFLARH